ncbi:MAG: hypothetical protein IT559_09370 [Alphaproteobacteria bacterium]|nr:hypothetical protein [Alphaproteobacteria bacterium]
MVFSLIVFLGLHNVSSRITDQDRYYIQKILEDAGFSALSSRGDFDTEIAAILAIQNAAFHTAPATGLIPLNTPREPKNLYEAEAAYCSDRARFIEKALRLYGFKARFASIYENTPDKNFIQTLLTKGLEGAHSHAVVEVKTTKGWLVIDTRTHWISLDWHNNPHDLREIQRFAAEKTWPEWSALSKEPMFFLMKDPFYILYGVYSRHGRFYAPYTPYVPDIDFTQLLNNFTP